jgi:hypothetical protein
MLRINEERKTVVFFIKNLTETSVLDSSKLRYAESSPAVAKALIDAEIPKGETVTVVVFSEDIDDLVSQSRWKLDRAMDLYYLKNETRITRPVVLDEVLDYRPVGISCINRHTINKGWSKRAKIFPQTEQAFRKHDQEILSCLKARNKAPQLRRSIGQSVRLFRMANEAADHVSSFLFHYCALEVLISSGSLYKKQAKLVERLQAIHPTKNRTFIQRTANGIYRARGDLIHSGIFFDGINNRRKDKPLQEYIKQTRHFYLNCLDALLKHAYNEKNIENAWGKLGSKEHKYSIRSDKNTTVSYRRWTAVRFLKHAEALNRLRLLTSKVTPPFPSESP